MVTDTKTNPYASSCTTTFPTFNTSFKKYFYINYKYCGYNI